MFESLNLKDVRKVFQDENGETEAISNFSYSFKKGTFTSIVGPSGCGKSTLLSIISGLEPMTSGVISMDNSNSSDGADCSIGYMLQKDFLLDFRNVRQNVLLGLECQHRLNDAERARVDDLLRKYGLLEFKDKFPRQLSGGMRQRVALIRTLAVNPDVLLLDEAFSALDYQTRIEVTSDVYRIIREEKRTTIMVTHDIPESISMSDAVIVLTERPCRIKSVHEISFDVDKTGRTPVNCRDDPKFSRYFNEIWKELKI